MGNARKYTPEQIVNILRQIEVAVTHGKTHPIASREAGITEADLRPLWRMPWSAGQANVMRANWFSNHAARSAISRRSGMSRMR